LFVTPLEFLDILLILEIGARSHPAMVYVLVSSDLDVGAQGRLVGSNNIFRLVFGSKQQMRRGLRFGSLLIQ
jgi:hypothetical protein